MLSGSVVQLIVARVLQGFGASLMTPQTMAVITRTFPADNRGQAMGVWGSVAGAAKLVGPVMGGVLIASLGWEWIFFINVPVGVIAFVLAWKYVPVLPVQSRRYDVLGIALSGVGMFCLVFAIHEGHSYSWGRIVGPISVWGLIITGVLVITLFLVWQAASTVEPLLPLGLFADRNFSLANVGVTAVGFAVTAMAFPLMLYAQSVRGLSPVGAALLLMPMALISGVLAPFVGKLVDRTHPRLVAGFGLLCFPSGLVWLSVVMTPASEVWVLLLPIVLLGVANAFVWSPLSTTATRNLPMHHAGAGAACRLQHHAAGRLRARQRVDGCAHAGAANGGAGRSARRGAGQSRGSGAAGGAARGFRPGDGAFLVASGGGARPRLRGSPVLPAATSHESGSPSRRAGAHRCRLSRLVRLRRRPRRRSAAGHVPPRPQPVSCLHQSSSSRSAARLAAQP